MRHETVAEAKEMVMDPVFVARLNGSTDLLLLAELGLDEGSNVTFDNAGRQATVPRARFDAESEREMDLDSTELSDAQRTAYVAYWARRELAAGVENEVNQLLVHAKRHPFRHGMERRGGGSLQKGAYALESLTEMLRTWLMRDIHEGVVGEIGNYAGQSWLSSSVPDKDTGAPVPFEVHADSRALGVALFLSFVSRCGGTSQVRARRSRGQTMLVSRDGEREFYSGRYFYFSQST
ncbi:hypothetical protein D7X96_03510 [Corallococcus interemptor]|uniref:Uncharacterized protein n=1 Tax=Corallococcus interemptor TaxID=2316720 RepID=A0A3A8QWH1_9BACT|nr:hypothetical protein [Corallococcus interemptor]RKH73129.1 hypothetical protein D7X96_03510 [Corallococcus interemptor]